MALDSVADRSKRRRLPNVDPPKVADDELRRSLEAMREHLRMYEGDSGAPKERFVTIEELEKAGLVGTKVQRGFALIDSVLGTPVARSGNQQITIGGGSTATGKDHLYELLDTAVDTRRREDFLYYDDGVWRNFPLFTTQNNWRADQEYSGASIYFDGNYGIDFVHADGDRRTHFELLSSGTEELIVGDPSYPIKLDGSLVELEYGIGINWDNGAGTNAELLVFDTAPVTVNGVPPTAISAKLSFTQSAPGFMSTYNEVVDESGYGHAITYGSTVEADDGTLVVIPTRAPGNFFFAARAKANSWVELAPSSTFDLGTGDFCIEIVAYRPTSGNPNLNSGLMATGNLGWRVWWMSHSQGGDLRLQLNDVDVLSVEVAPWTSDGEWNHIAFVRSGTTITLYYNGVARGSTTSSADFTSAGGGMIIGEGTYSKGFVSYAPLDDFRLTKGYPRYTENFTPPSIGYTEDQESQFIVGDPNYVTHIDGSLVELEYGIGINWDNGAGTNVEHLVFDNDTFGLTVEPDPNLGSVTFLASFDNATLGAEGFAPEIGPAFEWNLVAGTQPSQVDGEVSNAQAKFGTKSLYAKDTSGPPSAGWQTVFPLSGTRSDKYSFAGDFTIEFHIYVVAESNNVEALNIWDFGDQQWTFHLNGGRINFQVSTTGGNLVGIFATEGISPGNTAMANNTWYHLAVCRQGDTHYCFIDGVLTSGGVNGVNTVVYDMYEAAAPYLVIFQEGANDGMGDVEAYIDNIRITDGVARYTTGFTPPAAPYEGSGPNTLFVGDPGYPTRIDGNTTTVAGDLTVNGATQLDSTLDVTGATTLASTLDVTGAATFNAALSILDSSGGDSAAFSHDGTDFNTAFTTTTDWNITGITSIQAGTVDADFDAITATSYGGILEANLLDKTAAEAVSGEYDFSAAVTLGDNIQLRFGASDDVTVEWDSAGGLLWQGAAAGQQFWLYDGMDVRVYDSTDTDYASFQHDGTDFNTAFGGTTDWNITGLTGAVVLGDYGVTDGRLFVHQDADPPSLTSTADDAILIGEFTPTSIATHAVINRTGINFFKGDGAGNRTGTGVFVGIMSYVPSGWNLIFGASSSSGTVSFAGGGEVGVRDGGTFRIYNAADDDYAEFSHDGTDFNTSFTAAAGTTDWNITGLTSIQAGTVDADFDAITATSYGGIVEANLLDLTAAETVSGAWTFSDELLALSFGEDSSSPASTTNAITFDLANGAAFEVTLTENITTITISNPPTTGYHAVMTIKFIQDATGSWTVSGWPAAVKWVGGSAPTITGTATTGTDIVRLETWDAGTTWYGTYDQNFS